MIFIFSLTLSSCYAPEQDCDSFQTGTFKFEALVDGEIKTTKFVRSKDIEIEYYDNKADTAQIRWINNCEYVLRSMNPEGREERQAMHFKILTTDNNKYTFEYSLVGSDNKQKGVAYKVEE